MESDIPLDNEACDSLKRGRNRLTLAYHLSLDVDSELLVVGSPIESHGRQIVLRSKCNHRVSGYDGPWRLEVEGAVVFGGFGKQNEIFYKPINKAGERVVGFWFVHQVLPLFLSFMKGWRFLHASSIENKGKAVLFLARSEGGKSTTAEFFVQQGHGLISDDKIAVETDGHGYYSYVSHSRYRPYRRFEDLGIQAEFQSAERVPVDMIFYLSLVGEEEEASAQSMTKAEAFHVLVDGFLFEKVGQSVSSLSFIGGMASQVPMYRLFVPKCRAKLSEVYKQVISLVE